MELILLPLLPLAGLLTAFDGGSDGDGTGGGGGNESDDDTPEGSGNDQVAGGASAYMLTPFDNSVGPGGEGNDTLNASDDASPYGRAGDDSLTGWYATSLWGEDGDDTILHRDDGTVRGDAGDDSITLLGAGTVADGGAGNDLICINQSGTVIAGDGGDTVVTTLRGSEVTLGAGQDLLAVALDDENGTHRVTDFYPAADELGIKLPKADRAGTSISLVTDGLTGFSALQIKTGDAVKSRVLQGITSGVSLCSIRLYADEAALVAGTSYATA